MMATLTVFLSMLMLDFVWAVYTRAVAEKRPSLASTCASAIIVLSGTAAIGYVNDPWMLIPAAAGAFVGTFLAMNEWLRCVFGSLVVGVHNRFER